MLRSLPMRALPFVLIAACATTSSEPQGGPRGLHATEHMDEARMHDKLARHRVAGREGSEPWVVHWDTATENEQAAAVHRSHALDLRTAYETACKGRTLAQASTSPLDRYAVGGTATEHTVVVYLDPSAGPPERLLADLECHRAWMMLAPEQDTSDPLDLPGLVIDANGYLDGIAVSITTRDPAMVAELQRRAAHLLEARHLPHTD